MRKEAVFAMLVVALLVVSAGAYFSVLSDRSEEKPLDREIVDMAGRTVKYSSKADRFVAQGASALRLYCYGGDVSKIVGIEGSEKKWGSYEGRPYMLANPQFLDLDLDIGMGGPRGSPDKEKLLDAKIDVIFTTYNLQKAELDQLEKDTKASVVKLSAGEVSLFDPETYQSLRIIGKITRSDRGDRAVEYFESCKNDLMNRTKDIPDADKVISYLGAQSYGGNHGILSTSHNYALFTAVNAVNGYAKYLKDNNKNPPMGHNLIDFDVLADINPDVIFLDAGGLELVREDYGKTPAKYNALKAFQNNNVYVQMPYNWYASNQEVAIVDAYFIGKILYPEKFADVDLGEKYDQCSKNLLGAKLWDKVKDKYPEALKRVSF